jgi:phage shock protein PspC (stress-responsive transcriptional regulator)
LFRGARRGKLVGMSEYTTHTPHVKRLERSSQNKVIAGVCGGLGRYFDLNPTVFRLGLVVLTLLGGAGILVYIAAILVVPAEEEPASIAERALAQRRDHPVQLVALGVVGVAVFVLLSRADAWPSAGAAWFLALVVGLAVLWASKERRARRLVVVVVTTAVLALAALVTAVVVAFSWFDVSLGDGVGDYTYAPASVAEVGHDYNLGVGTLKLDLSHVSPTQPLRVKAHVGVGELRVVVPQDAAVVVDSRVKLGSISSLDHHDDGRNAHVRVGRAGQLFLDARVGAGEVKVLRRR